MASKLLNDLIASRFSKLAGLAITGTVPLQQDLVNEALAELVESWSSSPHASPAAERSTGPLPQLLGTVRKLQVRAEQGVINVDFEIGV